MSHPPLFNNSKYLSIIDDKSICLGVSSENLQEKAPKKLQEILGIISIALPIFPPNSKINSSYHI